jgi:hypothetical protein
MDVLQTGFLTPRHNMLQNIFQPISSKTLTVMEQTPQHNELLYVTRTGYSLGLQPLLAFK